MDGLFLRLLCDYLDQFRFGDDEKRLLKGLGLSEAVVWCREQIWFDDD